MKHWRYWRIFRWTWPRADVRRYGAIPDGITDCTAAFHRALAKNGTVHVDGTFQCTGTLISDHENSEVE